MKEPEHVHPAQSMERFGRTLAALLVPLLLQLLAQPDTFWQALTAGISNLLLAAAILFAAVAQARAVRFGVHGGQLELRRGLLLRKKTLLFPRAPDALFAEQTLLLRLLGAYRLRIINGGGTTAPEAICLSAARARRLFGRYAADVQPVPAYKPTFLRAAATALAHSNAAAGLLIAIPFVRQTGKLLGAEAENALVSQFDPRLHLIALGLPPLTAALVALLLVGWVVAFLAQLFETLPFDVYRSPDRLIVENGLFPRRSRLFQPKRLRAVTIRQTLMMRLLGVYSVFGLLPATSRKRSKREALLLTAATEAQLTVWLRREWPFPVTGAWIRPPARARVWYTRRERIALPITAAVLLAARLLRLPSYLLLVPFAAAVVFVWLFAVHKAEFPSAGIRVGAQGLAVHRAERFTLVTTFIPYHRIRAIELRQTWFQRKSGLCTARIRMEGVRGAARVRCLKASDVRALYVKIPERF